ncbi:SDR family NAD(P)-dependent oxidoreductase [Rufibacter immobilis]|uniref:SDR family NAD(P)-dependent oxidoreductase n=1 Tax=Rufibacter immobilis TaxID=1348778 RepID=A0A3M9MRP2_9BACT|nr:SDR family oxidoreductase [Rufibacter immobilis]RNI27553.1 SDR family NAD(P)-dependent oxidoreductase [Rufibacter immobilis]
MAISLKPLHQQVMVITGASSGIGLATAKAAAAAGAQVVLAARSGEALRQIEEEIIAAGGQAIHVVADVAKQEEVQRIADAALARHGRIDTWVNNAGLGLFGYLEEIELEDHRQLFNINFWGVVHGSLVAVKYLKQTGGALINIGSLAAEVAFPLQGMYVASKHAVNGFTNSLRVELAAQGAPVSVTLINPAGINTPFDHHGRNYTENEPQIPPPVYEPKEAAHAILQAATHPHREIYVGGGAKMMSSLYKHFPAAVEWFNSMAMTKVQLRDEPPRDPLGTLYEGSNEGNVRGDWPGYVMKNSLYTRASLSPVAKATAWAALGVVAITLLSGMGKTNNR